MVQCWPTTNSGRVDWESHCPERCLARSSGWAIELGPLDRESPTLTGFLAGFPQLVPIEVDPIPMIRREPGLDDATDYLSPAMRRTLRKATNRLATDYRTFDVRFTRSHSEIRDLLSDAGGVAPQPRPRPGPVQ